jgi:hypothetical protein
MNFVRSVIDRLKYFLDRQKLLLPIYRYQHPQINSVPENSSTRQLHLLTVPSSTAMTMTK